MVRLFHNKAAFFSLANDEYERWYAEIATINSSKEMVRSLDDFINKEEGKRKKIEIIKEYGKQQGVISKRR